MIRPAQSAAYTRFALLALLGAWSAPWARAEGAATGSCVAKGIQAALDPETAALQGLWVDLADEVGLSRSRFIDTDSDFRRVMTVEELQAAKDRGQHPIEAYGETAYLAWRAGDDYLRGIPPGRLSFDESLWTGLAHALGERPRALGRLPRLVGPLPDIELAALRADPWSGKVVELSPPLSRPGQRRAIIAPVTPAELRRRLARLKDWYERSRETLDPVELAFDVERAVASLAPLRAGNDRAARLLRDRVLAEHGLPPPLVEGAPGSSPALGRDARVAELRAGILSSLELSAKEKNEYAPEIPAAGPRNLRVRLPREAVRAVGERFVFGGRGFRLGTDGFFRSDRGIPHVFAEGQLRPISDGSYSLYFVGAEQRQRPALPIRLRRLRVGEPLRRVYRENFRLAADLRDGRRTAAEVVVAPYSTIEAGNRSGVPFLHPWQRDALAAAVEIPDGLDPSAVLAHASRMRTGFAAQVDEGRTSFAQPSLILAQYELADSQYVLLERAARAGHPDLLPVIARSRERLHRAGRELLAPYLRDRDALSPVARAVADRVYSYRIFEDYLAQSKLSHADLATGLARFRDDTQVVLRNSAGNGRYMGFWSHSEQRRVLNRIPGMGRVAAWFKRFSQWMRTEGSTPAAQERRAALQIRLGERPGLLAWLPPSLSRALRDLDGTFYSVSGVAHEVATQFFSNRFAARGSAAEFQRLYIDQLLHSWNQGIKPGTSYTTHSTMLTSMKGGLDTDLIFANLPGSRTYIVRLPREGNHPNVAADFLTEYEVTGFRGVGPRRIVSSYDPADPRWIDPAGRSPGVTLTPEAEQFLKTFALR